MRDYFRDTIAFCYSLIARLNATLIAFKIAIGVFLMFKYLEWNEFLKCMRAKFPGYIKINSCVKCPKCALCTPLPASLLINANST